MIKFITFNTKGLSDVRKRSNVLSYIRQQHQPSDLYIIGLQETHCMTSDLNYWTKTWTGHSTWTTTTSRAAGCAILLSKSLTQQAKILHTHTSADGRYAAVRLQLHNTVLHIHNLYAPNDPTQRKLFFSELLDLLTDTDLDNSLPDQLDLPVFHIVLGDFNCVPDLALDKVGGDRTSGDEGSHELHSLTNYLDTVDIFRILHPTTIATTFNTDLIGSRLDRIYLPHALHHTCATGIIHPPMSDHELVWATIRFSNIKRGPGYWKLNTSFLGQDLYQAKISRILLAFNQMADDIGVSEAWEVTKKHVRGSCIRYASDQAALHNIQLNQATTAYTTSKETWTRSPSLVTAALLHQHESELDDLQQRALDGAAVRSRASWLLHGERPTRLFCSLEKQRQQQCTIPTLVHPSFGSEVSTPAQLCDAAKTFYQQLYTAETASDPHATTTLCDLLPHLRQEQRTACDSPLSLAELTKALGATPRSKTPGLDGLPAEFYSTFWPLLGPILLSVLLDSINRGQLPPSMSTGVLCLLFKKGDPTLLGNYRPLTMINTDAKLLAKVLALRLDTVLPGLVHPSQTGFIRGRYIHENTLLVREMIAHHRCEKLPGAIMFVDQEKAFDRVDWDFRDAVLQACGFGPFFRSLVTLLHAGLNSQVIVNGHLSSAFTVRRGTRQGDPLSPGLFALLDETIACYLRASPLPKGIALPDGGYSQHAVCSQYADDKALFLSSPDDIAPLHAALDLYSRASGARINVTKSRVLLLGPSARHPEDWTALGVPILQNNESIKYLGVPIGPSAKDHDIWLTCIDKLERMLGLWRHRDLTLLGRVTVIRTLATSQLWYLASILPLPPELEKRINTAIYRFLWRDKRNGLVARDVCLLSRSSGGLGMIDIGCMVKALQFSFLRRYLDPLDQQWKHYLTHQLRENAFCTTWGLGTRLIVSAAKLSASASSLHLAPFWRGVLCTAQQLDIQELRPTRVEHVLQQHLFYNERTTPVLADATLLKVASTGVHHMYHLVYDDLELATPEDAGMHPTTHARILAALPTDWTDLLRVGHEPFAPDQWVLTTRLFPVPDILRVRHYVDHQRVLCEIFPVRANGIFDPSTAPAHVTAYASALIRCHVVNLTVDMHIVEATLDRLELDASRVTVCQGANKTVTPILESSVHGTAAALISKTNISHLVDLKWSRLLDTTTSLPWPRMWHDTWSPTRRAKVSDFLWRLWHQRLFLGIDRRHQPDPGPLNCPHPACSQTLETYEHFLFACPVAQALWSHVQTLWRDITGRSLSTCTRAILIAGPSFRSKAHRVLWLTLQGEALYSLWLQRCRSRLDDDPAAYTSTAVIAASSSAVKRAVDTLNSTRYKSELLRTALDRL